jgi:hypothetical protein
MGIFPFRNCTNIATFPKSGITVKFQPVDIPLIRLKRRSVFPEQKIPAPWQSLLSWRVLFPGIKFNHNEENL